MGDHRNDGHSAKLKLPVLIEPNIGLDSSVRLSIARLLNIILSDEMVLSTKTRNAHWNVHGAGFFELHTLFESQYHLLNNICDEIAERVRMLGGFATGGLAEFLDHTRLKEQPGVVPDILHLLADHETCIRLLREDARKCSEEYEDEGTVKLLVSVMRLHEKTAWMLRSYIESEALQGKKLGTA